MSRFAPGGTKIAIPWSLFQRATQTYRWALPLSNTLGMKVGTEKAFGAGYNVLPVCKKRLDAKTLITTPNSDVIYAMSYVDLSEDGALVFHETTVSGHPRREVCMTTPPRTFTLRAIILASGIGSCLMVPAAHA